MIAVVFLAGALLALGFVPLFGGPRYEAALLAGIIAPSVAIASSSVGVRRMLCRLHADAANDKQVRQIPGASLAIFAAGRAGWFCFVVLLVATIHGVLAGYCEPDEGFALLMLGPCVGIFLAASAGAWVGAVSARLAPAWSKGGAFVAAAVSLCFPLASALFELWGFYSTPVVYAYDEFAGYFAGPLYDATEFELQRLLTYRVGTLGLMVLLVGVLCALSLSFDGRALRWGLLRTARRFDAGTRLAWVSAVVGLLVWAGLRGEGQRLGHRADAFSIRSELGRTTARKRCHVHFSRHVPAAVAMRIARECEGHLNQLGRYFEVQDDQQVQVYLFADDDEKRRLIGAARTNVAKPWRREVYIRPQGFPHAVLGHELAHVVAGTFGRGPFRIAGPLRGWVPDPGRVEGFAEAAAVREHSEGTLLEWAAAMRKQGQLPAVDSLFRLSFFGNSAARSYTAAGAFVEFLRRTRGTEALKRWYGGATLRDASGATWAELELEFGNLLDETVVPPAVAALAKPRFSRPGVFERRCPHAVDRQVREGHALCGSQPEKAKRLFSEAVLLDPSRVGLELVAPRCDFLAAKSAAAEAEYVRLLAQTEQYSPEERHAGWEQLGDLRWHDNRPAEARSAYQEALELNFDRDVRRRLEVKVWALAQAGLPSRAIRELLAPSSAQEYAPSLLLQQWQIQGPHPALASYLLSRLALLGERPLEAKEFGESYEPKDLPLPSLRREGARTQVLVACAWAMMRGQKEPFARRLSEYQKLALGAAERLEAERLQERCLDPEAMN